MSQFFERSLFYFLLRGPHFSRIPDPPSGWAAYNPHEHCTPSYRQLLPPTILCRIDKLYIILRHNSSCSSYSFSSSSLRVTIGTAIFEPDKNHVRIIGKSLIDNNRPVSFNHRQRHFSKRNCTSPSRASDSCRRFPFCLHRRVPQCCMQFIITVSNAMKRPAMQLSFSHNRRKKQDSPARTKV